MGVDASVRLREKHKDHFTEVTLPFMVERGATHYAWIPPGDNFGYRFSNTRGAFAYLFSKESKIKDRVFPALEL